ncbi:MAG: undecaprenyl/decaprenyl-phosphate alpha-N-acetylglucosaminyl 1-phosphate transferase [Porticoccaceae bacterium]|nr:undecaprenyl/decaprenyl-phosphate alpha-N-acetylglucosaminyl 1-phosphate transferase [Porticoccaceae bacterium]
MLLKDNYSAFSRHLDKYDLKLVIMCLVALWAFGLVGVGAILLMRLLSSLAVGRDQAASHGISVIESSRLGGLAITLLLGFHALGMVLLTDYIPGVVRSNLYLALWTAIFLCACLGLCEDIKSDFLSPVLRLSAKFVVFALLFWGWPTLVPDNLGLAVIDQLLKVPLIACVSATVFCVGFINAFNMSDGANGLVPGIATAAFTVFFIEYGRPVEGLLFFICFVFLLFNVISGWFFLGDMGSYGLGAIIALYGLNGVAQGDFSASFMMVLLAYPCLDFAISITRRLASGRSPFSADNNHLHNRLHWQLQRCIKSRVIANSLTGLLISCSSAGIALIGYILAWRPANSDDWVFIFALQVVLYGVVFVLAGRKRPITQFSGAV